MKHLKKIKPFKTLAVVLSFLLIAGVFCACAKKQGEDTQTTAAVQQGVTVDTANATVLTLNHTSIDINGTGAKADGTTAVITEAGTYVVSGTLDDGRLIVDADGAEVTVILNGAEINCSYSSAFYVYESKSTVLYLQEGSQNSLSDAKTYTYSGSYDTEADEEPNACVYAKDDLTIAGSGALTVNGNYHNAITSKDTLTVENATITVSAKDNGVTGKDSVSLSNATLNISVGGDGVQATNDKDSSLGFVEIRESNLNITTGGTGAGDDTSAKGIKAETDITINGGTYVMDTSDDAIHANQNVTMKDGTFTLSTSDDGIHADNTLKITGGTYQIKAHEGLEATQIFIEDGTLVIDASDDGINAAKKADGITPRVEINGGDITINMGQGDTDAIDSNGDIYVNGGTLNITGQSAFDYDGTGEINGGTVYVNGEKITQMTSQFAGGMGGPGGMGGSGEMGGPGGRP